MTFDSDASFSMLYPEGSTSGTGTLSQTTLHDLGFDSIVKKVTPKEAEQTYILRILAKMTSDPHTAAYRSDIFEDIYRNPGMRDRMMEILDKINFLKDYGSFKREHEESASTWELMHRLEEIHDYIGCVEAVNECLEKADIRSEGLKGLRDYVGAVYHDHGFAELKKDIEDCKGSTAELKSVTLGVNLNDRFEAESIGLVSINSKKFSKSGVIGNFSDMITARTGGVKDGTEWRDNYKYHPFTANDAAGSTEMAENLGRMNMMASGPLAMMSLAAIPEGDNAADATRYMDRIVNHILAITVRKLKDTLNKYVNITITNITNLIPEFMYYIRWAEYFEKLSSGGLVFAKPEVIGSETGEAPEGISGTADSRYACAKGIYNLKLADAHIRDGVEIVPNDISFDTDDCVYILTGANRGGKTTVTQAAGQLFVLAQGGLMIPGSEFRYMPVDCIYTHFPADEDRTMDLGRLGEECSRFREIYCTATDKSLLLLNETFSTTSFEEGYYIARDSVRAILKKGIRTIYNTHMHKLAYEIDSINAEAERDASDSGQQAMARSLIVCADGGERSFRIKAAPPEGMSYAEDIAKKYGVTYDMLLNND